eukprot:m.14439 g.14439  ORF g.14439 m.14439 type:complete len:105 (+) comp4799_c0_seq1:416-730(+)
MVRCAYDVRARVCESHLRNHSVTTHFSNAASTPAGCRRRRYSKHVALCDVETETRQRRRFFGGVSVAAWVVPTAAPGPLGETFNSGGPQGEGVLCVLCRGALCS